MIEERYRMNLNAITKSEMQQLESAKVCIVGCGGLGGHIIEMLARLGVGHLVIVDGDTFHESNLNRQLFSREDNIGESKAKESAKLVGRINSNIKVDYHHLYMSKNNAEELLAGCLLAVDALDNVEGRLLLEKVCSDLNIPLVHGAIGGWYGQVAVVMPGSKLLEKIYGDRMEKGEETSLGNPAFIAANIASIQVAECVKLLAGKESPLKNAILEVDLLFHCFDIIKF